ncbi:MAG: hypothetical protein B6241_05290 [Spirochaetaceae bacterium 4572_59]|nr:MAG: hypothetical protein B6241_05290 [Spirochaetaceae bacterium 4572_59]
MAYTYKADLDRVKKNIACFRIDWSPFILMDRFLIHGIVPSDGGIFQVFQKINGALELIMVERAFYGGLRNRIRELIDPLYMGYNPFKKEIQEGECYVRYALVRLQDDMDDLMYYYTGKESTGRYKDILVDEKENLQIRKNP